VILIKKKTVSFIITVLISIAVCSLVFSAVSLYYTMPMNATVEENVSLAFYVENVTWLNNTDVAWGTVTPGSSYQKTFDVHNTGTATTQIIMYMSGLPSGWDLTYNRNGTTVAGGNWLNGTMTLSVSPTSSSASYYWTCTIYVS